MRVACTGDAGATCSGKVRLKRGKKAYGSKSFRIPAGKTATVRVKLRKSARKAVNRSRKGKTVQLTVRGTDSAGQPISVTRSVKLLRAKRK